MGCNQTVIDIARMAGRITQPRDARERREVLQQPAERPAFSVRSLAVIGVDVLSDQRELAHAVLGEPLHVVDDLCHRPRDFRATRVRHDAEGAELVAAFLHRDESGNAAGADRAGLGLGQEAELVLSREFGLDGAAFIAGALQQLRQMMIALRSHHDVDRGCTAHDLLALGLCHAACDRDLHGTPVARGGVLGDAQAAELRIDLFRGLLADMAGVEDDEVGVISAGRLHESFRGQRVHHALGIVDVHLAAI
ncbi:hypothetical protein ACVWWI_007547 [Bradyrhizobium sp. USDA 3686]